VKEFQTTRQPIMAKVLRIINRFNLGGITYNVTYLSKYLPPEYETLLIGGPQEEGEESSLFIPESLGLKPVVIEEMRRSIDPLKDLAAYRKIKKIIHEFKPDIVHTHASKAGTLGRLAARSCGVPVIVHTFHGHVFSGYFSPLKTALVKTIERWLAKKSTAIIAISNKQKEEISLLHKICAPEKITVIPLGFDLERFHQDPESKRGAFRKKYGLKEDELALGIIGRLAPIKDHFLFVDAIAHVKKESKVKIKGIIIGDGEMRKSIEEYCMNRGLKTEGIEADIIFTSWIKNVDGALPGLDIICLTSKNEGTPVSLIEAQAAGKFVVSTNVGGIQDILHKDRGFLSEKGDRIGFMENLLRSVNEFRDLNKNAGSAQKEILEKFSYARLCRDANELYQKLLKKS
jgi:glycosyltransferase involved in cell wall biosynthesis